MKIVLLGATGLIGDTLLQKLVLNDSVKQVTTLSRRSPKVHNDKIVSVINSDTSKWYTSENLQGQDVAISAFGTTRSLAGGSQKFREIEMSNIVGFIKAAKANNVLKFILVSTMGADSSSYMTYTKVKGEIEDILKAQNFESAFILRPGFLSGPREGTRLMEKTVLALAHLPILSRLIAVNKAETVAQNIVLLLNVTGSKSFGPSDIDLIE